MSFNKKTITIALISIFALLMVGCSGQTVVPTATVAPTVEEPTAVPTEAAEEQVSPVVETETADVVVTEETGTETETETETAAAAEEPAAETEAVETETDSAAAAEEPAAETEAVEAEAETAAAAEELAAETEAVETETETAVTAEEPAAETEADKAETETAAAAEEPAAETEAVETETEAVAFINDGSYAASVDNEGVSIDEFVQMTTFNRYQYLNQYNQYAQMYSMYGLPLDTLNAQMISILGEGGKERLGTEAVDQLTYDKVLRKEAEKAGIEFTDEEVYAQLKRMFGYEDPDPNVEGPMGMDSFNVDPIATTGEDDKNQAFRSFAQSILEQNYGGLVSFDFLKEYAHNILIDNTMFATELEQRTFEAEMVNARHILVADEETAKSILARLEAGEDWAALASENSLDTANKDDSGSLGWFGRGEMVAEFENAAFALEPGEISEPVQTNYGFHIIASDGKEIRPLSGAALEAAQNAAYDEWSLGLRSKHDIQSYPEVWMDAVPMVPEFTVPENTEETAQTENSDEVIADSQVEESNTEEAAESTSEATDDETAADSQVEESNTEAIAETPVEASETEVIADSQAESSDAETTAEENTEKSEGTESVNENTAAAETEAESTAIVSETSEGAETSSKISASEETADTAPEAESASSVVNSDVVAVVDGNEIKADEFAEMAVFNRYQILSSYNQYAQYYAMFGLPLDDVNAYYENLLSEEGRQELGSSTINQLAYFKMLNHEAAEMGLEATNKEAVDQMKVNFGYGQETAEAENSLGLDSFNLDTDISNDDADEEAFKEYINMDLSVSFNGKISYEFFREYVRNGILENKVVEKLLEGRVFEEEMVNARHILVEDEETAKELLEKLNAGEEWDALAAEYSKDTGNKDQGGALGWFGRNVMVSEFEDAAFALEPGEISEPVKSSFGWHIIASDGKEIRPMEDEALQAAQNEVYDEWYQGLQAKYNVESYPEVWLPLVPLEPAFEPVVIDPEAQNPDIPTFHIISDEEETEDEKTDNTNTDQTVSEDDEELTIRNTEQNDDEAGIKNTEQENLAYIINNDAENK